jgi:hypothetical protein
MIKFYYKGGRIMKKKASKKAIEATETKVIIEESIYTKNGIHTCQASKTQKCKFLGFHRFGLIPVCMLHLNGGSLRDYELYETGEGLIVPRDDCPLRNLTK